MFRGWARIYLGEPEAAIEPLTHAMRLSPLDRWLSMMQAGIAFAHFFAGRYDEAAAWAEKSLRDSPNYHAGLRIASASNALIGRMQPVQKAMARLRQIDPALRIVNLGDLTPVRRAEDLARYEEGLRKAGLPE
jgi:tetratricopeptide (TPR) repeat protein